LMRSGGFLTLKARMPPGSGYLFHLILHFNENMDLLKIS
jgi:hypothetical protein